MAKEEKEQGISKGMLVGLSILAAFIFVVLITVSFVWGTYNTLVIAKQDINSQWSNVQTEYQRRADIFYNLVEVTKSYADFEQETMIKVTQARSGAFSGSKEDQMNQMNELDSVFSRLLLVMEKYPDLKAIDQYNTLSAEVARTENRVQIARSDYNSLVRSYNILILRFPKNLLANMFGYSEEKYFESKVAPDEHKIKMD